MNKMKKMLNDDNFERLASRSILDMPVEIRLPVELVSGMQIAWDNSFPRGQSQEQGGVLVRDNKDSYKWKAGKAGTSGSFIPNLDGSRAWWALGQFWLAVDNDEAAIICAQAGLEELGDDYADPMAIDDTQMKLWVAQERIQKGHLSDGADMMLRILQSRLHLYAEQRKHGVKTHACVM